MKAANILILCLCGTLSGCVAALATVGSGISDAVVGAIKDETSEQVSGTVKKGVRTQFGDKENTEKLSEEVRANRIARLTSKPSATDADLLKAWDMTRGSEHEDIRDAWGTCSRKYPENLYRLSGQIPAADKPQFAALVSWLNTNGCTPGNGKAELWQVFTASPESYPVLPAATPAAPAQPAPAQTPAATPAPAPAPAQPETPAPEKTSPAA